MHTRRYISLILVACGAGAASADGIDGRAPLECTAERGHDCLPTQATCSKLERQTKIEPVLRIDFSKNEVHSPFRKDPMRITHSTGTSESLILQGGEESGFAWSALIRKKAGAFTISIADREGAYVIFGTCRLAKAG
jgi:hypothetical protein